MGQVRRLFSQADSASLSDPAPEGSVPREPSKVGADNELFIRRAFAGDPAVGMSILFQQYYQPLCSHAVRYVSSREIAEDIVSDIFYEFHSRELFHSIEVSYRAFLYTAVRNRAFDYVRQEMRRTTSLDRAEWLPVRADQQPDTITQYEELYQDVERAIHAMPVKRRQVYLMHRFEGKKYAEIAANLNLSTRTVEVHMYRAIHHVREWVKDKWLLMILFLVGHVWAAIFF
ncbi:DNA-directed RNA polymerase sigma-70 factor [Dyadobacter beijingensis]|uniref:DNA-directed RNA polymerase sigma-70 factor n=1 Tax=Dyadobacter beijingensis TaxID=365489 RepID=A0ABQ2HUQ5_9BACT|nr:RNA polymerase sigma-70 factor [Dyadobacter beijingensis]GGM90295.1 DNA-directed RNA polymerase sigma-70 factor [Dyadobacter beijingensis]